MNIQSFAGVLCGLALVNPCAAFLQNLPRAEAHPVAPWSHHYKICQHRDLGNCRQYADQRVGQPLEGFGYHTHNYAGITHNH